MQSFSCPCGAVGRRASSSGGVGRVTKYSHRGRTRRAAARMRRRIGVSARELGPTARRLRGLRSVYEPPGEPQQFQLFRRRLSGASPYHVMVSRRAGFRFGWRLSGSGSTELTEVFSLHGATSVQRGACLPPIRFFMGRWPLFESGIGEQEASVPQACRS